MCESSVFYFENGVERERERERKRKRERER
jgi:hypothetical protein